MTKTRLTKSTAMALCLALAAPTPGLTQNDLLGLVQSGGTPEASVIDDLDRAELVRLASALGIGGENPETVGTDVLRDAVKAELGLETGGGTASASAPAEEMPAEDAADAPMEEQPSQEAAEAEQEAAEVPAEEQPVEDAAQAPAEEQPADDAAEAAVEEQPAEDAAEAAAEDQPAEDAADAAAEEQPAEDTAEAPAEEQPAEDAAEAPVEEQPAEDAGEAPAEEQPAEDAADAAVEEQPVEEAAEAPAEDLAEDAAEAPVEEQPAEDAADATAEETPADGIAEASAPETTEDGRPADSMPLAAANDAAAEEGEVTTETLTEDDVRSSAEEFETEVIVDAEEPRERERDDDDDDDRGLSNAETAAAIGLGVLALSQILGGNDEVVSNSGDRVVIRRDGELQVLKDDDVLLRQPGAQVETRRFDDGSTRAVVTREDGTQIITVRAADGTVIRRVQVRPDGSRIVLIDDTEADPEPVIVTELPEPRQAPVTATANDREALEAALNAQLNADVDRRFSLRQVRNIREVRHLMPEVTVDAVNFQTGSAVIQPGEAEELADLGTRMAEFIAENPDEVFLVEGHTDTVGGAAYNLALSDRRAESVALALVEYFDVPPENLVIQGYGESDLLVPEEGDVRANRRATVRRITPLLQAARID